MNFFEDFKVYAPVTVGSSFEVTLEKAVSRANPEYNESDPQSIAGYVDFYWVRTSDGCPIRDSRLFPVGVRILTEQLQEQGLVVDAENRSLGKMVADIVANKQTFKCWVTETVTADGRHFKNYNFREPVTKAVPAGATVAAPTDGFVAGKDTALPF